MPKPASKFKDLQMNKSIRLCPLCLHDHSYRLIDLEYALFDDSPISPLMYLVSCASCGFVFYDTESNESSFNDFYRDHYFIQAYCTAQDYHSDPYYMQFLTDFLRKHGAREDSRIVDAGCGQGQLVRSLKSTGFKNIAGVELCQEYVNKLNEEGYEAHYGSVLEMPLEKQTIDLIIFKHIFEHLYDPRTAVKAAYEYLSPGGCLLVAIPDAALYSSFTDYSPLHYLTIEHINHFDQYHVKALFESHGFEMEEATSRMLDISEDYPVPIMYCLLRKPIDPVSTETKPDFRLAEMIFGWFVESKMLCMPELTELLKSHRKVYVWGISYRTSMYLAMSPLKDCNIEAYVDIDKRKQKKRLFKKRILSPDILKDLPDDVTVVIGVGPSSRSMKKSLLDNGFKGEIIRLI